jgi:UDP-glucose 4-epimerase
MNIFLIGSEGYIGTYLRSHLNKQGHKITSCDLKNSVISDCNHIIACYSELSIPVLSKFDCVINVAGHSSVKSAQEDPLGAIENNAINIYRLALKCKEVKIPLIYASSGSIFSSSDDGNFTLKSSSINTYDGSKMAGDLLLSTLNIPALALCFGTVSGWSPKIRNELVFNSMNISAYENKIVNIWNGENLRSILFLDDLAKYVDIALANLKLIDCFKRIQLYSWSGSINDLGSVIASYWGAKVNMSLGDGTYSFVLSDHSFRHIFQDQIIKSDIHDQCKKFIDQRMKSGK